ncbi:AtuA-related protein [Actinomadura miaoliensis]|uniref:AtuA-like ferredoxin-fold domain-containing protein n=1 Tax=Actinomadura miaoliensis TaxID=430685 RepID=A0ABP7VGZ2_9ACTN
MRARLHDVAHARTGDKGDTSTVSIFPYRDEHYPDLVRELTPEVVRRHLGGHVRGEVVRYELPSLCALHFVCRQSLDGGVTTSLALDTHGKGLSSRLLSLEIEIRGH